MSNIESTKDGLVEISSGKKIVSPLDMLVVCDGILVNRTEGGATQ